MNMKARTMCGFSFYERKEFKMTPNINHRNSAGSALIYILIAVALLAALTVSLMEPSSQQGQSQSSTSMVTDLSGQISFITSGISECVLSHPDQDSELTTTQQKNAPYPINPKDPYFNTHYQTQITARNISDAPEVPAEAVQTIKTMHVYLGDHQESSFRLHQPCSQIGHTIMVPMVST